MHVASYTRAIFTVLHIRFDFIISTHILKTIDIVFSDDIVKTNIKASSSRTVSKIVKSITGALPGIRSLICFIWLQHKVYLIYVWRPFCGYIWITLPNAVISPDCMSVGTIRQYVCRFETTLLHVMHIYYVADIYCLKYNIQPALTHILGPTSCIMNVIFWIILIREQPCEKSKPYIYVVQCINE